MGAPALPDSTPDYFQLSSALAFELAAELTSPTDIFLRHGIEEKEAIRLLADPTFKKMITDAKREWTAEQNVPERIRLKSQLALEELLLPTFNMAKDPRVPPASRTDATKLFERLSGVTKSNEEQSGGTGPKYILTINLGGSIEPKELTGMTIEQTPE